MVGMLHRLKDVVTSTFGLGSRWGRIVAAVGVAGLLFIGSSGTGSADMRIVQEVEGERQETFYKNNRIATPIMDGSRMILYCDRDEVAVVSSAEVGRYWQGTISGLKEAFESMFVEGIARAQGLEGADDMPDMGAMFAELFGGGGGGENIPVRVSRAGRATVAGYEADHHVVEVNQDGEWRVAEELWVSSALLNELSSEVGACVAIMVELQDELAASFSFGMDELDAILSSPDYQRLMAEGYPVRSRQAMMVFGMEVELSSEVVEVNRQPISEDVFTVPAGYERVNTLFDLVEM